jgi:hypothetical protein
MSFKLLAGVAVIAAGIGMSGAAPVHATPTNPLTPCSVCLPGPGGGPGGHVLGVPGTSTLPPIMGAGPKFGHPSVMQPRTHIAKRLGE